MKKNPTDDMNHFNYQIMRAAKIEVNHFVFDYNKYIKKLKQDKHLEILTPAEYWEQLKKEKEYEMLLKNERIEQ